MLGVVGNWSEALEKAVARGGMARVLHDEYVEIPESLLWQATSATSRTAAAAGFSHTPYHPLSMW